MHITLSPKTMAARHEEQGRQRINVIKSRDAKPEPELGVLPGAGAQIKNQDRSSV